jgi:hypothetical protein
VGEPKIMNHFVVNLFFSSGSILVAALLRQDVRGEKVINK